MCARTHVHMSWPQLLPTFNHLSQMDLFACKNLHILGPLNSPVNSFLLSGLFSTKKVGGAAAGVVAEGLPYHFLTGRNSEDEITSEAGLRSLPGPHP